MAEENPITSEAALDDQLAITRTLPIPNKDSIPQAPPEFRPTNRDLRSRRLRTVGAELEAELFDGVEECAELGKEFAQDLGEYAPPVEKAVQIAQEGHQIDDSLARLYALAAYLEERKAVLKSDALIFLEKTKKEYDYHAERKPQIAEKYKRFQRFFEARSRAISTGIAEANKKKTNPTT